MSVSKLGGGLWGGGGVEEGEGGGLGLEVVPDLVVGSCFDNGGDFFPIFTKLLQSLLE